MDNYQITVILFQSEIGIVSTLFAKKTKQLTKL